MNSDQLFEDSLKIVPGGVHSPVRSFKGLKSKPRFFTQAGGAFIKDCEGKEYIDFCMSFGPLIAGHTHPKVKQELMFALGRGWSYGACEPYSLDLAHLILDGISFIDQIRFVNSGTEAVMTALRLARGFTGKNKIIKFNGCYHGHTDAMLIKAGSGLAGTAEASSLGVPKGVADDTLILELNNEHQVKECFEHFGHDIAAVIIEPLPANNGLIPQRKEYLEFLRDITKQYSSLLIFDEVISGFRVAFGGMAEKLDIEPDIVTYGKIIGGGLPVGALAGKQKIMQTLAPVGGVYQAGTLSANPLAMVGGKATLELLTKDAYTTLENNTKEIVSLLQSYTNEFEIISEASLFWLKGTKEKIQSADQIPTNVGEVFSPVFEDLLDKGIYLAPNGYEVGFVSLAHDQQVIDKLKSLL